MLIPKKSDHRSTIVLLGILFFIDFLFILCHVSIFLFWKTAPDIFLLDAENISYAELFQYVKYMSCIAVLFYLVALKKTYSYLPVLILFLLLFVDDLFQLHYWAGYIVAHILSLHSLLGVKALPVGLLLYAFTIGAVFMGISYTCYHKASVGVRKSLIDIFILLGIFFFFGVIVDLLHVIYEGKHRVATILRLLEEGGEMLSLSLLTWYFWQNAVHKA